MPRFKMTIAYDGTAYKGWQSQPDRTGLATVQREVEKAAGYIVSHPVVIAGSSRTDTGVHARGQVATVRLETKLDTFRLRKAINSRLPLDILIRSMEEIGDDFSVRNAKNKRYRYVIWNDEERPVFNRHYVYHFYRDLNLPAMQDACARFVGTHDFNAFRGSTDHRENTVRTIFSCAIHRRGPLVIFAVEGSGFMYHMVRTMVGSCIEVGMGRWTPEMVTAAIESKDRREAGPCAPAQGLCLQWIRF